MHEMCKYRQKNQDFIPHPLWWVTAGQGVNNRKCFAMNWMKYPDLHIKSMFAMPNHAWGGVGWNGCHVCNKNILYIDLTLMEVEGWQT